MIMQKLRLKNLVALFGIALFIFILSQVNIHTIIKTILSFNLVFFVIALSLLAIQLALKGAKWKLILKSQSVTISIKDSVKYFLIGLFFSSFTPGRLGDLLRAFYLRKVTGIPRAISSVILDRLLDVITLLSIAFVASIYAFSVVKITFFSPLLIAAMIVVCALAFGLLLKEHYLKIIMMPLFDVLVSGKLKQKLSVGFTDFFYSVKLVLHNKKDFTLAAFIGIISWVFGILFAFALALSIGIAIPFHMMFLIMPFASLADTIPATVSGIGTRDAVLIVFFSLISLSAEQAVAFSLLFFLTGYVLTSLIGYLSFLSEPLNFGEIFA